MTLQPTQTRQELALIVADLLGWKFYRDYDKDKTPADPMQYEYGGGEWRNHRGKWITWVLPTQAAPDALPEWAYSLDAAFSLPTPTLFGIHFFYRMNGAFDGCEISTGSTMYTERGLIPAEAYTRAWIKMVNNNGGHDWIVPFIN
jgi:hypothetical protein